MCRVGYRWGGGARRATLGGVTGGVTGTLGLVAGVGSDTLGDAGGVVVGGRRC